MARETRESFLKSKWRVVPRQRELMWLYSSTKMCSGCKDKSHTGNLLRTSGERLYEMVGAENVLIKACPMVTRPTLSSTVF